MTPRLEGVIVLDKPSGLTSHDAVARVRRATGEPRVGHAGTLDPLATGVLPLVLGRATRLVRFLPGDPKVYAVTARLGLETTTGDVDGAPLGPERPVEVADDALEAALARLRGPLLQRPPLYSAKKVAGLRLHRAARAGIEVERRPVPVTVHGLRLVARRGRDLDLEVACSPGTYVRSLVTDLGAALGTGAAVTALARLRSGPFTRDQAVALEELGSREAAAARLLPLDRVPLDLGEVSLAHPAAVAFAGGRSQPSPGSAPAGWVSVRTEDGTRIGVGEIDPQGALRPRVVLVASSRELVDSSG